MGTNRNGRAPRGGRALVLLCALVGCGGGGAPDAAMHESGAPDAPAHESGAPDALDGPRDDASLDGGTDGGNGGGDGGAGPQIRCATQWPHAASTAAGYPSQTLYTRVHVAGVSPTRGADPRLVVEHGYGPRDEHPSGPAWRWAPTAHNTSCLGCAGDDEEFMGVVTPHAPGELAWAARARYDGGPYTYCDRADEGRAGSADGWSAADAPTLAVASPGGLRALTLNLRCLLDDWPTRRDIVADALAAADPELLGLQEVCAARDGRDNLTELLAALSARTGRRYATLRAVTHVSWDTYDEGVALATPYALAETTVVDLPPGLFPRKLLAARVVGPQGPVVFATTHLDSRSRDARANQLRVALEGLERFAGAGEGVLLVGDLNETPGDAVGTALAAAGFRDLWPALRPEHNGFTFPASGPTRRIDYVWLRPGASGFAPAAVALILDAPVGGVFGSDHLGVSAHIAR